MTSFKITPDATMEPLECRMGDLVSLTSGDMIIMVFDWTHGDCFVGTIIAGTSGAGIGNHARNWEKAQFKRFRGTVELKS